MPKLRVGGRGQLRTGVGMAAKRRGRYLCPDCDRAISITPTGKRKTHHDRTGSECTGSRVQVLAPSRFQLDELPPVVMPRQGQNATGNKWSGKP